MWEPTPLCVQAVSYTLTPTQIPPDFSLLTLRRTHTNKHFCRWQKKGAGISRERKLTELHMSVQRYTRVKTSRNAIKLLDGKNLLSSRPLGGQRYMFPARGDRELIGGVQG